MICGGRRGQAAAEEAGSALRAEVAALKAEVESLRRENEQVKHLHTNQLAKVRPPLPDSCNNIPPQRRVVFRTFLLFVLNLVGLEYSLHSTLLDLSTHSLHSTLF